jgi:hypothetical protein
LLATCRKDAHLTALDETTVYQIHSEMHCPPGDAPAGTRGLCARLDMNRWRILALAALLYSAGGCQSKYLRTANQDLERENFQLEQRLDQVTWELADTKAALQACQCGARGSYVPASPAPPRRDRTAPAAGPSTDIEEQGPPRVELPEGEARSPRLRRRSEPVPKFMGPPVISPPRPDVPDGVLHETAQTAPTGNQPPDEAPIYEAAAAQGDADRDVPEAQPRLVSQGPPEPVAALVVNPKLTVWRKTRSETSSDEGLRVVVEPRNAAGNLIAARGDVAVAVLDPSQNGSAARLARWDFSDEEVSLHFKGTQPGGGLHFSLQWPAAVPTVDDLLLFVRLTTPEGQQFVAEYALRPTSATDPATWTEVSEHDEQASTGGSRARASVGWQRASRPIDPLPASPMVSRVEPSPAEPEPMPEAAAASEPAGPSWAPYR